MTTFPVSEAGSLIATVTSTFIIQIIFSVESMEGKGRGFILELDGDFLILRYLFGCPEVTELLNPLHKSGKI